MVRIRLLALVIAAALSQAACLLSDDALPEDATSESSGGEVVQTTSNFLSPEGVVVAGGFVFVANTAFDGTGQTFGPGFVTVVRQSDLEVVNRIFTSYSNPQVLKASGDKVYVLCSGTTVFDQGSGNVIPTSDASLEIIDIATAGSALAPQDVTVLAHSDSRPLVGYPSSLAFSPDGKFAFAGSGTTAVLFKYDMGTGKWVRGTDNPIELGDVKVQDSVAVESGPTGVVFAGSFVLDKVWAIDTATNTYAASPFQVIDAGLPATGMDGVMRLMYRAGGTPDLFVLLGLASQVMGSNTIMGAAGVTPLFDTGTNPNQIAISGDILYVLNSGDNNVTAMEISTNKDLGKRAIFDQGVNPYDFAFSDEGGTTVMFVTGFSSNTLYQVDPATGQVLGKVQ